MRFDADYWDHVESNLIRKGHYLDAFMGELKAQAYLGLIRRWCPDYQGPLLKTDLFEEANGVDAMLWRLGEKGQHHLGMDLSPQICTRAQQNDEQGTLSCVASDARTLPFADNSIGFVLSPSTLDHFADEADLQVSLREIQRVMKPGGRMLITLANRHNVGDPLLRLAIRLGLVPYFIGGSFTVREMRQEVFAAGFRVDEETAIVHNPRMMAAGLTWLAKGVGWRPFSRLVQGILVRMQALETSRWRWNTGCFVAALAVKPIEDAE